MVRPAPTFAVLTSDNMPSRHSERLLPFLLAHARRDLRAISMVFSPNVHLQDGKILVRPQTAATAETPKHP